MIRFLKLKIMYFLHLCKNIILFCKKIIVFSFAYISPLLDRFEYKRTDWYNLLSTIFFYFKEIYLIATKITFEHFVDNLFFHYKKRRIIWFLIFIWFILTLFYLLLSYFLEQFHFLYGLLALFDADNVMLLEKQASQLNTKVSQFLYRLSLIEKLAADIPEVHCGPFLKEPAKKVLLVDLAPELVHILESFKFMAPIIGFLGDDILRSLNDDFHLLSAYTREDVYIMLNELYSSVYYIQKMLFFYIGFLLFIFGLKLLELWVQILHILLDFQNEIGIQKKLLNDLKILMLELIN